MVKWNQSRPTPKYPTSVFERISACVDVLDVDDPCARYNRAGQQLKQSRFSIPVVPAHPCHSGAELVRPLGEQLPRRIAERQVLYSHHRLLTVTRFATHFAST